MVYATTETYQYETFLGTLGTASTTGVRQLRTQERDETGEAFSAALDRWVTPTGVEVHPGAVMRRKVSEDAVGVVNAVGPWEFFAYSWEPAVKGLKAVAMNRQVKAAAGQPMRNPLGLPIVLPDGTRPNQPATGEPARDQWTGELIPGMVEP